MTLQASDIWASGNPPPSDVTALDPADQGDVANGFECGQPMRVDGLNFMLSLLGNCTLSLQQEIVNVMLAAGLTYDPNSTTNLIDGISELICQSFDENTFAGFDTGDPSTFVLPAGGTWRGMVSAYGSALTTNAITPNTTTTLDERDNSTGGVWGGTVPGGTSFAIIAGQSATAAFSYFFVRVDK